MDITDGNLRITLGLIWTLILRYQVNRGGSGDENAKSELLKWVQSKIPEYNVTGFKKGTRSTSNPSPSCYCCSPRT